MTTYKIAWRTADGDRGVATVAADDAACALGCVLDERPELDGAIFLVVPVDSIDGDQPSGAIADIARELIGDDGGGEE